MIVNTGKFTVSVLSQAADFELFKRFGFQSGRDVDKFEGYEACRRGENGIYYVTEGTNAYISAKADHMIDLGSHTMFIGEITDMDVLSKDPSVTYEYYLKEIKPKPEAVGKTENGQTVWRCKICGYEYVGKCCRRIMYVRSANTRRQTLKRLSAERWQEGRIISYAALFFKASAKPIQNGVAWKDRKIRRKYQWR